ncbi:lipopolysaccharide assembly protein LapA domain-containing protein [Actinoplanes sp. NPDC051411]|uniref:lipopolysaccharide assembly protein LapA domain-containing protein n=1 Tax=Actinoplanes sp. NPDC051411 TaxID=3155522 RepID=UPI003422CB30
MTTPADNRPPEEPLPPRPPAGRLADEPAPSETYRDPASIPTTEVEPIPAPGTTAPPISPGPTAPRMFTRISAAWLGVWAGILVVILLIVFIAQNTAGVRIRFLWMDGVMPTALALLIAGVGGAIIAMAVAAARIVQLRRLVRRRR